MSKKNKLICAALCAVAWLPVAAQHRIDVTDEYLTNPSFEEGTTVLTEGEGVILGSGGTFNSPDGWIPACELGGWVDVGLRGGTASDVNFPQVTDGSYLLNLWAGTINNIELSQELTGLPNGNYTITADMMTSELSAGSSRYGTQRVFAITESGLTETFSKAEHEYTYAEDDAPDYGALFTVEVTVEVTDGTLTVGFGTGNGGSSVSGAGFMKIDNVRLYRLSNDTDELLQYLSEQIMNKVSDLNSQSWTRDDVPEGDALYITGSIGDGIIGLTGRATALATEANDADAMQLALDSLNLWYNKYDALNLKYIDFLNLTYEVLGILGELDPSLYSDYDLFNEWVLANMVGDVLNNENAREADLDRVNEAYPERYRIFLLSQAASATNPADFTAVISTPNFTKVGGDIAVSDDLASTGWVTDNVFTGGSDVVLKHVAGQNSWNSWSNNFLFMEVSQELNNLPEGLYSISCETTTNGTVHDQHAFATSSMGTTVSNPPSPENCYVGSDFDNEASWEIIETGKLVVTDDGKLKIGMASSSGGGTSGWFCVTKFRLSYYGMEDMEIYYQEAFTARIAYAGTLVDNEMLPSEKTILNNGIAAAGAASATTIEEIKTATAALNEAIEVAENGAREYTIFKVGAYKTMEDLVVEYSETLGYVDMAEMLSGYLMDVVDPVIMVHDTTTTAAYVQLNSDMQAYIDFGTFYTTAAAYTTAEGYDATAQETYTAALAENVTLLNSYDLADIDVAKSNINTAIRLLKDYSAFEGSDVTFWITNPSFEDATFANGWTNNGFQVNTAQVTADENLDGTNCAERWVNLGNALGDFEISQTFYVPNGLYHVSAAMKALQQGTLRLYNDNGEATDSIVITDAVTGVFFYANNTQTEVATPLISDGGDGYLNQIPDHADWPYAERSTLENVLVDNNRLTIGMKTEATQANWVVVDDFKLSFVRRDDLVSIEDVESITSVPVAYTEGATIKVDGYNDFVVKNVSGLTVRNGNLVQGIYFVEVPGFGAIKVAVK